VVFYKQFKNIMFSYKYSPTPYNAEKVYIELCTVARTWELERNTFGLREPHRGTEGGLGMDMRLAAEGVLREDWGAVRKQISKFPMEMLEMIPDFAWNTIHLAGK